jgi:hypothetical protein
MYDVIYIDRVRRSNVVGTGLERASAVSTARTEARRRRVGRMFPRRLGADGPQPSGRDREVGGPLRMNGDGGTGRWPISLGGEAIVLVAVVALFAAVFVAVAADLAGA